jgi:2'-5' RNA ligase
MAISKPWAGSTRPSSAKSWLWGWRLDNRAYQPHLTLGRVRDNATSEGKRHASEVLSGLKIPAGPRIHGNHASLMRTTFTQRGAVHDALFSASLRGN